MRRHNVVLLGELEAETGQIERIAADFGWAVEAAPALPDLLKISSESEVPCVLFTLPTPDLASLGMARQISSCSPNCRPILCIPFGVSLDWDRLADNGVFHSLRLPLKPDELRQSLGFVWAARRRLQLEPASGARATRKAVA